MTTLVADVETTTWSKGSPFDTRNKLVCIGLQDLASDEVFVYYEEEFEIARQKLKNATRIIGFNLKFDLHWLRKYDMLPEDLRDVWDCQLFEFMLSKQRWRYPSLEETVSRRFDEHKVDIVKEQYWEQGINTDEIPRDILTIYTDQDIRLTTKTYLAQQDEIVDWYKLFRVHCADLLVLEEMEWNGLYLDVNQCEERAEHDLGIIDDIEKKLRSGYESVPINFDSTDHLSAYLYGGEIIIEDRVPIGFYKTGIKAGQVRNKVVEYKYELPRLIEPVKGSELKKDGLFSTSEDVLRSLKLNRRTKSIVEWILERSKLQKLVSTYYQGIPKLIRECNWEDSRVFSQYNQCVTATGRLSSTKPNGQNFPPEFKELFVSRYE